MNYVSRGYRTFQFFNIFIMLIVTCVCLYPFLYIVAVSFSDTSAVLGKKVSLFPVGFNLNAYKMVIEHPSFLTGYMNTIIYTITGTFIGLFMTVIFAYPLSKRHLRGRNLIMRLVVFTMFFGGGLIPNFIVISSLGFVDKIWAIIIPGAISSYNLILVITFLQGLPAELEEAAAIDGMNPIQILYSIILPLSKPVLATIGLFMAVFFWNDWFYSMIYLNRNEHFPVMLFLRNIVMGAEIAAKNGGIQSSSDLNVVAATLKASTIMLVTLPILISYPFIQKYFVKGVMLGSVKG